MTSIYHKIIGAGLLLSSLTLQTVTAQQVEPPRLKKATTAFAIVVDNITLQKSAAAIHAYRDALEAQGLATYIVSHPWQKPEEIREQLKKLYAQPVKLEGAVLVGDIPVPMIRNAQHLTSTFKMDQRLDWKRSSVPSDRFYDDFDLQFDFLKQDSLKKNYFYYNLSPRSPQYIHMDIYTARIKPAVRKGEDPYAVISAYLLKAVAEKKQPQPLNDVMVFTGQGYHSESLNAWAGEQLALKEQFPHLFAYGNTLKFFNFRMATHIKYQLLSEIQRPELDMALFHEHGDEETQILNGYPYVSNPQPSMENIKRFLRAKIQGVQRKKGDVAKAKEGYVKSMNVPLSWMDDALDPEVMAADSLFDAEQNIVIDDLVKATPNARFVMLDACENGSFHLDDYLAAHYSFGKGKTIVTLASSVGIVQDQWSDEMLGLLQYGVRTGNWFKQLAGLETHLFGDPTFAFKGNTSTDLNNAIVNKNKDAVVWEALLKHPSPDVQCLALAQLFTIQGGKISGRLKDIYFSTPSMLLRLEALKLLNVLNNDDYHTVLKAAVNDPYELTRRLTASWIGDWGSDEAVPALVSLAISDRHSKRVASRVRGTMAFMDATAVISEVNKQLSVDTYLVDSTGFKTKLIADERNFEKSLQEYLLVMPDTSKPIKERLFNITTMRAYAYHAAIPTAMQLISDKTQDEKLRVAAMEALSWFTHSWKKESILQLCKTILADAGQPVLLKEQAERTQAILRR